MYKSHISLVVRVLLGKLGDAFSGARAFDSPRDAADSPRLFWYAVSFPMKRIPGHKRQPWFPPIRSSWEKASMDILFHRREKHIRIPEIRLEEDRGRLIHGGKAGARGADYFEKKPGLGRPGRETAQWVLIHGIKNKRAKEKEGFIF